MSNVNQLVKSHTSKIKPYNDWLEEHCRQRQYCFQIKKCSDINCCSPSSTQNEHWLLDPVLDESGEQYKSFEEVYGTTPTEKDRPTYSLKQEKSSNVVKEKEKKSETLNASVNLISLVPELQGDAHLFTAQNCRSTVNCKECDKPSHLLKIQAYREAQDDVSYVAFRV